MTAEKLNGKKRHDAVYRFLGVVLRSWLTRKFNYEYDNITVDYSPYFVISNHLTNWDPLLVGLSFRKSMYYVATDHIFRMGPVSKLISFLVSPIARLKTAQETQTVIAMFRRLRENCNICIFAEGNASFDGVTGEIPYSIGKLIKRAGVALVTYRLSGGYFTFPRWARFIRRGKMTGRLARIYSPEQIQAMSEQEIYAAVTNDLYVNAWDDQEKCRVTFRGKRPAEYLETVLYRCPGCGRFSTLSSRNDTLFCGCGFSVRYNEYGRFETPDAGAPAPFETILEWTKWQRGEIEKIAAAMNTFDSDTPIFRDEGQTLFQVVRVSHNIKLARGTLCFYNNRISLAGETGRAVEFPLETIIDISGITMMKIIFSSTDQNVYEIHSAHPRSALKYLDLFRAWQSAKK